MAPFVVIDALMLENLRCPPFAVHVLTEQCCAAVHVCVCDTSFVRKMIFGVCLCRRARQSRAGVIPVRDWHQFPTQVGDKPQSEGGLVGASSVGRLEDPMSAEGGGPEVRAAAATATGVVSTFCTPR